MADRDWDDANRLNVAFSLSPFVAEWIENDGLDHLLYSLAIFFRGIPDDYNRRVYAQNLSFKALDSRNARAAKMPIEIDALAEELQNLAAILQRWGHNTGAKRPTPESFRAWVADFEKRQKRESKRPRKRRRRHES